MQTFDETVCVKSTGTTSGPMLGSMEQQPEDRWEHWGQWRLDVSACGTEVKLSYLSNKGGEGRKRGLLLA